MSAAARAGTKRGAAQGLVKTEPSLLAQALGELAGTAPERYAERMEELGYLANVLVSESQLGPRQLRPVEALEAALAITSLGLERAMSAETKGHSSSPDEVSALLAKTPADQLFRAGFRALCAGEVPAPSGSEAWWPLLARKR